MKNVKLKDNFIQVCVWPATTVGKSDVEAFEKWALEELDTRIQYLEEIKTYPTVSKSGDIVAESGSRSDVLFAVHNKDIPKFSIKRLEFGMRWLEDIMDNAGFQLYPSRIEKYRSW